MKKRFFVQAALAPALLYLAACELIAFPDTSGIAPFPDRANLVLSREDKIRVSFDFPVRREAAESLIEVKDSVGAVPGRRLWEGRTLFFLPEPPLLPGGRYTFSFSGTFRDRNGAALEYRHSVPFHFLTRRESAVRLDSADPAPGSVIAAETEILLRFSGAVDPVSFAAGFSFSPGADIEVLWEDGAKTARLRPKSEWKNLTVYTLSFGAGITDSEGTEVSAPRDLLYIAQSDTVPPELLRVDTAVNDPESGFPAVGTDLSAFLTLRDALRVVFSEPMRPDETREAVSLIPEPAGAWHWLDERTLLFLPETGYEAGKSYTISADSSARDRAGNRLLPFAPLSFTPRIDLLRVRAELPRDGIVLDEADFSPALPRLITTAPPAWTDYTVGVSFSGGFFETEAEKLSTQRGITLTCVFPPSAPDPRPVGWTWTSGNRLSVTFSGLVPSTEREENLYLLRLRGGPDGIRTSEGNFLPKTLEQLLVTGRKE